MWQTVVAAVGAVLAIGGYVWYKMRQASDARTAATQAQVQAKRDQEQRQALEAQIAQKAAEEEKELQHDIDTALTQPSDARTDAALDVLARVRGAL